VSGLADEEHEHDHAHDRHDPEHADHDHEHEEHEHEDHEHEDHEHEDHGHEDHGHEHHEHEDHEHGEHEPGEHEHGEGTGAETAVEAMLEAIRQAKVGQLVVSSISTFASVAYGKLEARDLPEAKAAIDVIDALLPFLQGEEEPIRRDFEQALTNLKLAYANAVSPAQ
jgi:hypothetical protein